GVGDLSLNGGVGDGLRRQTGMSSEQHHGQQQAGGNESGHGFPPCPRYAGCLLKISRSVSPAAERFASHISTYSRDKTTPSAPAPNAARTACRTSSGLVRLSVRRVGTSMSIPG